MTIRDIYEALLSEMNKVKAPSILLEDFNYFVNRAIRQLTNKYYNTYDINQQSTDNLRVLKSTAILKVKESEKYGSSSALLSGPDSYLGHTYEVTLPPDYLHLLNCICNFKVKGGNYKCYNDGDYVQFAATRCTADSWAQVINNFYMRPTYKKPYYYIHNVNTLATTVEDLYIKTATQQPTNKFNPDNDPGTTDLGIDGDQFPREFKFDNYIKVSNIDTEKSANVRYGNASEIRMEIRYGKDVSTFELVNVYVDYIKTPQHIRLTQEQIDTVRDTSLIMEFPDYVCLEIINELVHIIMENSSDPRLLTHIPISQSIGQAQQLTTNNN